MPAVEVIYTDEFGAWFESLDEKDAESVAKDVDRLSMLGVALQFPHQSHIKDCRYAIRELRTKAGGKQLREFYAFDPDRDAVLILGGGKSGNDRFYEEMIPRVERIWEQYLKEHEERKKKEKK